MKQLLKSNSETHLWSLNCVTETLVQGHGFRLLEYVNYIIKILQLY